MGLGMDGVKLLAKNLRRLRKLDISNGLLISRNEFLGDGGSCLSDEAFL